MKTHDSLFEKLRAYAGLFQKFFLAVLVLLVALNVFIRPYHPHVALEVYPGFWAVFGFVLAVAMAFVMKRIIAPIIGAPEDIHD